MYDYGLTACTIWQWQTQNDGVSCHDLFKEDNWKRTKSKNLSDVWRTSDSDIHQLSYAPIATKINKTSQLTPYGALPIAIVSRIMPAAASKTARSSLLLSECRGPFYSTIQRYNSAPPMMMTNASTVHAINLLPQRTSLQRSAPSNKAGLHSSSVIIWLIIT